MYVYAPLDAPLGLGLRGGGGMEGLALVFVGSMLAIAGVGGYVAYRVAKRTPAGAKKRRRNLLIAAGGAVGAPVAWVAANRYLAKRRSEASIACEQAHCARAPSHCRQWTDGSWHLTPEYRLQCWG